MAKEKLTREPSGFGKALETIVAGNPVRTIKIEDIVPPLKHDRSQYDESAIVSLSENIKHQGLLQPIIVRKLENGKYERIAGFRRLEAVKMLQHNEILARVIEASDLDALKAMLSENTQRVDLNVYDKAVFFEEIILAAMNASGCDELINMGVKQLRTRIERMRNRENKKLIEPPSDSDKIFEDIMKNTILSQYGYGIDSFTKFLNILDFDPIIVNALKEDKITRITAAEINKLSTKIHKHLIQPTIEKVVNDQMGSREVIALVSAILKKRATKKEAIIKSVGKTIQITKIPKHNRPKAEEIIQKFVDDIAELSTPEE